MIELIRELDPDAELPPLAPELPEPLEIPAKAPDAKPKKRAAKRPSGLAARGRSQNTAAPHPARRHPLHAESPEHAPLSAEDLSTVQLPPSRPSLPLREDLGVCVSPGVEFETIRAALKRLDEDSIALEVEGGRCTRVAYERIDAVTVARIAEGAGAPELVIDLLLNWSARDGLPLRSVRLRAESLEAPTAAESGDGASLQVRDALAEILDRSHAVPVPDPDTVLGLSVPSFESLDAYERKLLSRRPEAASS
jgi:hypothetical protein